MELNRLDPGGRRLIQSYGDGRFRISGQRYDGAVFVFIDRVRSAGITRFEDIRGEHLDAFVDSADEIDILLVGCGDSARALWTGALDRLARVGIAAETMDTGAACRTFNLLQADNRRVAALLIPVP